MKFQIIFLNLFLVGFAFAQTTEPSAIQNVEAGHNSSFQNQRVIIVESKMQPNILQGNFQVGGGASYIDSRIQSTLSLNPRFSFFFADYLSAGVSTLYFYRESNFGAKETGLGFGPNVTYYFSIFDRVAPFASIGLNFFRSSSSEQSGEFSSTEIDPTIGAQYFFTNALSFGVSLVSRIELANSAGETEPATNSLQGNFGYFF